MKNIVLSLIGLAVCSTTMAQKEWASVPIPAQTEPGYVWQLQEGPSDDFNYTSAPSSVKGTFGNKWTNFYHNGWDGPGTTYWQYDHVEVDGEELVIRSSRNNSTTKMGVKGVNAGCITSTNRVLYPVYVESKISVADITLASDVWLLSSDDTQEIDMIECYGGAQNNNEWFAKFIHLSHHSFIRQPFTDYQPTDEQSWHVREGVSSWGEYCRNNGNRKYLQIGVNWISPKHFEYYVDGELVRVLYDKAFATKEGNTWLYSYPTMTNGVLDKDGGYQKTIQYTTASNYDFATLQEASNVSTTSVIDPYNYQNGEGFTKELDIIINMESQDWHVEAGRTPTDEELADDSRNRIYVDWIRVYKPIEGVTGVNDKRDTKAEVYPNPVEQTLYFKSANPLQGTASVYNSSGTKITTATVTNNAIDVSHLQAGFFMVKLEGGHTASFIKK